MTSRLPAARSLAALNFAPHQYIHASWLPRVLRQSAADAARSRRVAGAIDLAILHRHGLMAIVETAVPQDDRRAALLSASSFSNLLSRLGILKAGPWLRRQLDAGLHSALRTIVEPDLLRVLLLRSRDLMPLPLAAGEACSLQATLAQAASPTCLRQVLDALGEAVLAQAASQWPVALRRRACLRLSRRRELSVGAGLHGPAEQVAAARNAVDRCVDWLEDVSWLS